MKTSNKELLFTKGEKVKYIGKGFIGHDRSHTEMIIINKVDHMSYKVLYRDFTVEVYSHEIAKLK